jgi:hypothetical protein
MSLWEKFRNQTEERPHLPIETARIDSLNVKRSSSTIDLPEELELGLNELQRRSRRRRLGETLAHNRVIPKRKPSVKDCFKDGSTVVHRRREDWSTQQSYVNCLFLDEHDTVLASDITGKIDLVRLPRYENSEKPRLLGTQLVNGLEVNPSLVDSSTIKMKSLKGGQAFVIGMPCGAHHIFSSERAGTWGDKLNVPRTFFTQQSPSTFLTCGWTVDGPRRRYYRDRKNAHLSLSHMIRGTHFQAHDRHELNEIEGWDYDKPSSGCRTPNGMRFLPHQRPQNHAKWDFVETNSSLLAAHVDSEHDCFWLRLIDDRVQEPVVCVDKTSHDRPPTSEEHITACAFASEHCLATAHVWCHSRNSESRTNQFFGSHLLDSGHVHSCVKLWDIRMISRRQRKPLDTVTLPQYPKNSAMALEPSATAHIRADGKGDLSNGNPGRSDSAITNLSAPDGNLGTLLVTAQSRTRTRKIEHHVLNLGRLDVSRKICQRDDIEQWVPVYGIAGSHNYMTCLGEGELSSPSILIYNLRETPSRSCGHKRRIDDVPRDDSWSSRIDPMLKDRHGLETQLSCIALNRGGTAIVGGSRDGDLFVWRGF